MEMSLDEKRSAVTSAFSKEWDRRRSKKRAGGADKAAVVLANSVADSEYAYVEKVYDGHIVFCCGEDKFSMPYSGGYENPVFGDFGTAEKIVMVPEETGETLSEVKGGKSGEGLKGSLRAAAKKIMKGKGKTLKAGDPIPSWVLKKLSGSGMKKASMVEKKSELYA